MGAELRLRIERSNCRLRLLEIAPCVVRDGQFDLFYDCTRRLFDVYVDARYHRSRRFGDASSNHGGDGRRHHGDCRFIFFVVVPTEHVRLLLDDYWHASQVGSLIAQASGTSAGSTSTDTGALALAAAVDSEPPADTAFKRLRSTVDFSVLVAPSARR